MAEYVVGTVDELPEGSRRIVKARGIEIGVFNVGGRYYALPNICPHQWGPLCEGKVSGTLVATKDTDWVPRWVQEGQILYCPWHSLEVDITTGQCIPWAEVRLRQYPVVVEDNVVKVVVGREAASSPRQRRAKTTRR